MVTQAKDLSLYTPNTRISAPPGASIDYTIDIINESSVVRNENLSVTGLPSTWTYTLQSGSYHIDRIAVLPGEKKSLKLKVEVPFQNFVLNLLRFNPIHLFNEATNIVLMPSVRSTGALTMEQISGTLPGALPVGQSLLMIGPQLTGLFASTIVLFALGYFLFMRREVRSR